MSRKHYRLLASIIAAHIRMKELAGEDCTEEQDMVLLLMRAMQRDNPQFDRNVFRKACGL